MPVRFSAALKVYPTKHMLALTWPCIVCAEGHKERLTSWGTANVEVRCALVVWVEPILVGVRWGRKKGFREKSANALTWTPPSFKFYSSLLIEIHFLFKNKHKNNFLRNSGCKPVCEVCVCVDHVCEHLWDGVKHKLKKKAPWVTTIFGLF